MTLLERINDMALGDSNCLDQDYRFVQHFNDKGQITKVETIFSKKFLRERNRVYDVKLNKYVKRQIFGGIS